MKLSKKDLEAALEAIERRRSFVPKVGTVFEFWLGERCLGAAWPSYRKEHSPYLGMSVQEHWGHGKGHWVPQTNMTMAAAILVVEFLS